MYATGWGVPFFFGCNLPTCRDHLHSDEHFGGRRAQRSAAGLAFLAAFRVREDLFDWSVGHPASA